MISTSTTVMLIVHQYFNLCSKYELSLILRVLQTKTTCYNFPLISGTYVDRRIIPGFYYRVCPNGHKEHLFQGRALKLLSIGMGYAKRLTFEPDSYASPDNYLWSDNHPDGLGLEPRAIHKGMRFRVVADGRDIGEASVFRVDMPQIEEKMEKVCAVCSC